MTSKEQHTSWLDRKKCEQLRERWGDYDEFLKTPNILNKVDVLKQLDLITSELNKGDTIIEVGCGAGHFLWALKDKGMNLIAFDYSPHMLDLVYEQFKVRSSQTNLSLMSGSCWEIELPDNYVDFSYQVDVCMHIGGSWESIKEMIRISKKYVMFTGPSFDESLSKMDKKIGRQSWALSVPELENMLNTMKDIKNGNILYSNHVGDFGFCVVSW